MVIGVAGSRANTLMLPPVGPVLFQVARMEGRLSGWDIGSGVSMRTGGAGGVEGTRVGVLDATRVAVSSAEVLTGIAVDAIVSQAIDRTRSKGRMIRILSFMIILLIALKLTSQCGTS